MSGKAIERVRVHVASSPRRRYRVNISLDEDTYNWVCRMSENVGESSTPAGTVAGMVHLIRKVQEGYERGTPMQPNPYGEIGEMFAQYAYAEAESPRNNSMTIPIKSK